MHRFPSSRHTVIFMTARGGTHGPLWIRKFKVVQDAAVVLPALVRDPSWIFIFFNISSGSTQLRFQPLRTI